MGESDQKFTWVQTHKDLVQYLKNMEGEQKKLVGLLQEAGVTAGLVDEEPKGNRFDLEEIDPFSFFCFIYKYGPDKRLKVLQNIAAKLDLHYPEDELGIPSAQAQKVMMFPFKDGRNNNEIENLWQLFYSSLNDSVTDEQFEEVLNQYGVGPVKITEALFYVAPQKYLPINGPTKPYLEKVFGIDPSFSTWQEYLDLLDKIKVNTEMPFYELSYEAWVWNQERKNKEAELNGWLELVERYKTHLRVSSHLGEFYKWEATKHFQDTFDPDADDFASNLKDSISKSKNLIYQNSKSFITKAAEFFPDQVRVMFADLYDEDESLQDRVQQFVSRAKELKPKVSEKHGKPLNHQQDERSLSFYLTMKYPDRYPLYKDETYQYLISQLPSEKPKPAGDKFFHYLEIGEKLIPTIEGDEVLFELATQNLNDDCYNGEQKWLVFQDILWVNMRQIEGKSDVNYWLFQGNPSLFDVEQALKDEALTSWRVNAHKEKIKPGDKVIIWASGDRRGCYALCEVESDVHEDRVNEDHVPYYHEEMKDEPFNQVELRITHNLAERPITYEQIKDVEALSGLKIGNQGTNFKATKEEYEAILDLMEDSSGDSKWDELLKVVEKIDDEAAVRKFFNTVKRVLNHFRLSADDQITYASSIRNYIQFTIGNRYVTHLERKKGETVQGFYVDNDYLEELKNKIPNLNISEKALPPEEGEMTWVYLESEKVQIEDFFEGIIALAKRGVDNQQKSPYRSTYADIHNPWIARVALDDALLEKLLRGEKMVTEKGHVKVNYPLNTIFYGPPGTGKTYNTIKRAAEIVEGRVIQDYNEAKQIFNNQLGETIEFITFHQNYSYEDFIQGLRPDIESTNELTFNRVDGIFKELCDRALKNLKESGAPITKKKSFDTVFNEFISPLTEGEVEELEVERKRVSYFITNVTERSIEFNKASGTSNHTLSIRTLKKMYDSESLLNIQGLSGYYSPLLDKLLELGKTPGETEVVNKKNYVLIIDEINRANISRVFGELITLIEPDKRYGREHHIPAKLPSGEEFSVPENLFIIGTMNTADKSIAQLDIALRRRFEFEAMYPLYNLPDQEIFDVDVLKSINNKIIELKGHDFQIGHSYFMDGNGSLKERMNKKVIPLLMEYFMNDKKEVEDVLKSAKLKIKEDSWPLQITGRE